jgi:hypothetical protein
VAIDRGELVAKLLDKPLRDAYREASKLLAKRAEGNKPEKDKGGKK